MRLRHRLWNPYVVVFLSSACIMVIELVASRLVAPRLGVSLYTWTSVIGVILAGISVGNYLGGRLADRFASTRFLGLIFALASLGSLSVLWLNNHVHDLARPAGVPLLAYVAGYIAIVFFLPSMILGCVSPVVVKLSLTDLQRTGTTVGKIYAWSSAGSIVGTFATGFFLVSWLGTKNIILAVAGLLMLLALWFVTDSTSRRALASGGIGLLCFGLVTGFLYRGGLLAPDCLRETNYYCINIEEKQDTPEAHIRVLILDRLVHSYSDLTDPTNLVYGYERTYAHVVRPLIEERPRLRALFIGGGGYTFPRYLQAKLPESSLDVVEIDPAVTRVAREALGLEPGSQIVPHNMDARLFLMQQSTPMEYDLVFGDAFNDYSVPFHLTTLEFAQMVSDTLRDDGLYVVNIVDGGRRGHFLRAYVRTLQQVFPHVSVIPQGSSWQDSVRTTFVLVASKAPYPLAHLPPEVVPVGPEELAAYLDMEPPLILRDDHVPVDNLLAPVFEDSAQS